jgi:hypothetical protein
LPRAALDYYAHEGPPVMMPTPLQPAHRPSFG